MLKLIGTLISLPGVMPGGRHDLVRPDPPRPGPNKAVQSAACEDVRMIEVGPLRPEDRAAWEVLARGYKAFYQDPMLDEAYEATWRRLAAGRSEERRVGKE